MVDLCNPSPQKTDKRAQKRLWLVIIGAVVGIALLLFGSAREKDGQSEPSDTYDPKKDELILYQDYLETRVKALCESVDGVSGVTAIVTLAGGFESVYATEAPDGNREYVILGSGSHATALYLTRAAPEIAGIGVVCRGASDLLIKKELTALLSATFRVSSNRIYVTEGHR